ncbi:hypothetical protein OAF74_00955 [bacterium]|jgi:Tfp pilus assembly protein FimT|nr:hypothetical protein [Planctomicrobium sp.]MDB4731382.1 hypothetical protein [bacterium]
MNVSQINLNGDSKRRLRSAFTVLELILVLTIIVAMAGLSWPRMSGFLKRESVMSDVETVRQVLDRARVEAIEDGMIYQFRYEPNGKKFVLLPYEIINASNQESDSSSTDQTSSTVSKQAIVYELSGKCSFYNPTSLTGDPIEIERLPEPWLEMIQNGTQHRDTSWAAPILYSPDGTATDDVVVIADEDKRYISLTVRGLTGAVTTSRLAQLPELFGASAD